MSEAQRNLDEALAKETDIYAPELYSKAESSLKQAKGLIAEKNYEQARNAAKMTSKLAIQASIIAEAAKTRMTEEVSGQIKEAEERISNLKAWQPPKRSKKRFEKQRDKWNAEVQALENDLAIAKKNLSEGRIQEARGTTENVLERASVLMRSLKTLSAKTKKDR